MFNLANKKTINKNYKKMKEIRILFNYKWKKNQEFKLILIIIKKKKIIRNILIIKSHFHQKTVTL